MTKFIREQVDRYLEHIVEQGFDRVIGTSGTILSLGTVATAIDRGIGARRKSATFASPRRACAGCARPPSRWISKSACTCPASIRAAPT